MPILVIGLWRWRRPAKRDVRHVANTDSLQALPSFAREQRRLARLARGEIIVIGLLILTLALVAARPQQQVRRIEESQSRDIVLCADISGSMSDYATAELATLKQIVKENPTDRYAMVLFQNAPYVALPLTNDSTAIDVILGDLEEQFASPEFNAAHMLGFQSGIGTGTDVGGGLASCIRRFDNIEQPRSRHIILVSDMRHDGITDQSAVATLLPKYGVKLYVLAPRIDMTFARQSPVTQIAAGDVYELADAAGTRATLERIYQSILNTRSGAEYVSADAPYALWGAALLLTAVWSVIVYLRWRRS